MTATPSPSPGPRSLARQWLNGICIAHVGHQRAAARYRKLHVLLGLPTIATSVIVGTSVFSSLASSDNRSVLWVAGALSVITAVLAGMQTFLNYGSLATDHQAAGAKYGTLRRRVESIVAIEGDHHLSKGNLDSIRADWDAIDAESPVIPQSIVDAAAAHVAHRAALQDAARPSGVPPAIPGTP